MEMPKRPRVPARIRMKNRAMRKAIPTLKWGTTKDEMPVNATIMTTGAETIGPGPRLRR